MRYPEDRTGAKVSLALLRILVFVPRAMGSFDEFFKQVINK